MVHKAIALDTASFLDSEEAKSLALPREDVRKIAEIFLGACYDELGKKPRDLDGQDVHGVLGHLMPAHFARKDPLAEHVPAVLEAYVTHLEHSQVVTQTFEIRHALASTSAEFLEVVRSGQSAHHHHPAKQAPVVHTVEKLGRNDPCSCGSGKKYKKCHGKDA